MTNPAEGSPPGPGRHARASGGQRPFLSRNRWYGVLLAGVPVAALAIGVILLTNGPDGHPASTDCGLVRCSAALPKSTSAMPQGRPQGKVTVEPTPPHRHAAAAPALAPSPAPSATTAPAPPSPSASPGPPASHRAHGHGHAGGRHGHGH